MGVPPFAEGAVKATLACPLPAVAVPMVGVPGVPADTVKLCVTSGAAW